MIKSSLLLVSIIALLSANAQGNKFSRCEIGMIQDMDHFQCWLQSKGNNSARKSTTTYKVPIVVHVLHSGDPVGEGFNYSAIRIESQIRTLNEDFRRKEGTPGFNSHPDGGDPQIEFILAQIDPDGNPTNGIVRVDMNSVQLPPSPPGTGDILTLCSRFSYWNPDQYLNIWCMDMGELSNIFFGSGRYPVTDLEGLDFQSPNGDGVFINALVFGQGETKTLPNFDKGRTLTHEMGHFLGLLHTFGSHNINRQCDEYSDYCEDTPPMSFSTDGCPSIRSVACDGRLAMIENYMDYSYDRCMNIFTNDQIARMHIVLENSPRRKSLTTSPVIKRQEVTGIEEDIAMTLKIYPNPATDRVYVFIDEQNPGYNIHVTAHTLLGKILFIETINLTDGRVGEILISNREEKVIVLTIEGHGFSCKQLIMIN
jgi:hypothetical protein